MHQHHHSHRHRVDCPYATLSSATHSSLSSSSCSWACIRMYICHFNGSFNNFRQRANKFAAGSVEQTTYTQYPRGHGEFEGVCAVGRGSTKGNNKHGQQCCEKNTAGQMVNVGDALWHYQRLFDQLLSCISIIRTDTVWMKNSNHNNKTVANVWNSKVFLVDLWGRVAWKTKPKWSIIAEECVEVKLYGNLANHPQQQDRLCANERSKRITNWI